MYLSEAITARAATDTGARDPDSLLGCLMWTEAGGTEKRLAKLIRSRSVTNLLDKARAGEAGRVPAFTGEEHQAEVLDFPDGLVPIRWKRDVLALLLRPDGATTDDMETLLAPVGSWNSAMAIARLRLDLKPFSIKIDSRRFEGRNDFKYRITGTSAWRLQKIIANGWSL
jgi:hypothetical protein